MSSGAPRNDATARDVPKVAVVGCGYWGKNLVRNFHALGALAAVCDRDGAILADMADRHGARAMAFEAILADSAVDGIVIATPATAHEALVRAALETGKHVFVEKPMALDVGKAKQLCRLADEKSRVLMVGHLLRYHPAFLKLTEIVRNGALGKIQYIYSNRLNLGKVRREENILWSFAPHDISMILSLVGEEPVDVRAVGTSYRERGNADVTTTHLIFPGGVSAHVFVSWLHPFKEQKLVVVGEAGMAVFDDGEPWDRKVLLYPHTIDWIEGTPHPSRADSEPQPVDECEPLRLECEHFLDCMVRGNRPRTDGEEGVRVLRVLKAAQDALDQGHDPAPFNRLQGKDSKG